MAAAVLASIDGAIGPADGAMIPATDDGLLRGDGVFEVIRLYEGRPYALRDHLDRIERSAAAIDLPVDRGALEHEIVDLLGEFGARDGALRIVATRGGKRLLLCETLPEWSETIAVATVTYAPSVVLTGVKSISYAANMQSTRIAATRGAEEAVLVRPDGVVLEAPTSSVFWVSAEGGLRTPALDTGILESITRDRLVRELHVEVGDWGLDELRGAHEAFLASTTREVQAISSIDGRDLPVAPGPRTLEARDAFARVLASELER
ncbi:MAG TPA: aminotransferase class IV [Solirubrobacterales bacterium]